MLRDLEVRGAPHRLHDDPRLAGLDANTAPRDRRESWVVDDTLIPTRDHRRAARSKNYRWSCNAQILIRRRYLRIVATTAGGPGNRNDPVHYRGSTPSRRSASSMVASSPTAATAASPSSSRRCFADDGSCATARGVDIAGGEHGSSTRSLASRTGVSCGTIAAAPVTSRTRSRLSPSYTTSTSTSCGTTCSLPRR